MFKAQRERGRMMEINRALVFLRIILQSSITNDNCDFHHLPKIEALRLAINYINLLADQVEGKEFTTNEYVEKLSRNLKNSTAKILKKFIKK
jgi:Ni,Fe-hydrogenase maturation factor